MRRTLLALGGVAMLATACGSSHRTTVPTTAPAVVPVSASTVPPTTVPAATTTTVPATTTTVPDTNVVPPKITVAYVDAVLAQLNHVYGDAVRASVKADKVTHQAVRYLQAIYNKPLGAEERRVFAETIAGGLQNARRMPGDPISTVQKLVYTSPSCIYVRVRTNLDPVVIHPVAPAADEFMGLQRPAAGGDPGANHTPWILFFDGVTETPSNVPNQCPDA